MLRSRQRDQIIRPLRQNVSLMAFPSLQSIRIERAKGRIWLCAFCNGPFACADCSRVPGHRELGSPVNIADCLIRDVNTRYSKPQPHLPSTWEPHQRLYAPTGGRKWGDRTPASLVLRPRRRAALPHGSPSSRNGCRRSWLFRSGCR